MLRIDPSTLDAVAAAKEAADLHPLVQSAIELEHSTIPPYLTALFSIKPGYNLEASQIVGSVVGEEMLHMAIACNLLNAIGGRPDIDNPFFVPSYPGPLPMGVRGDLVVGLGKLTRALVRSTFMEIEEPERTIDIPVGTGGRAQPLPPQPPGVATIGDFYRAIKDKLAVLPDAFTGDPARQVVDPRWYPAEQLFAITSLETATAAIEVVLDQGEGTTASPYDENGEVSHYHRFAEIVYGKRLVAIPASGGWAYAGAPVPLDPAGVWDLTCDAKAVDYPEGTQARVLVDAFNASYTRLLGCLHQAFNGAPTRLETALGVMVEMQLIAQKLVAIPVPGTTVQAAPTFEYDRGGC